MNKTLLFILPAFIWGTTWYAITFQLGTVPPILSVSYRFTLAGIALILFCLFTKTKLRFTLVEHGYILLQGLLLFGLNYWLAYEAETFISSGYVAVCFSLVVFLNALFSKTILGQPISKNIVVGAISGVVGTYFIFSSGLTNFEMDAEMTKGLVFSIISVILASLGNITSARNQQNNMKVIPVNALAMLYGGLSMFVFAMLKNEPLLFDFSPQYLFSMAYLALFGSIVAFSTYLTLIGKIGAAKAAFVLVVIPVLAMVISAIFESTPFTTTTFFGVVLIVLGNLIAFDVFKLVRKKTV